MLDECLKSGYRNLREPVDSIAKYAGEAGSEGAKMGALGFFCGLTVALIVGVNPLTNAIVCATVVGGAFFVDKVTKNIFKTKNPLVAIVLVCARALMVGTPGYLQISLVTALVLPIIWDYASHR